MTTRAIALVVFALLVLGLFLVPAADPTRLAATQAGSQIEEPAFSAGALVRDARDEASPDLEVLAVEPDGLVLRNPDGSESRRDAEGLTVVRGRPLWRHLVDGPAAERRGDGSVAVRLRDSQMRLADGRVEDPTLDDYARHSVTRALRATVATELDGTPVDVIFQRRGDVRGAALQTTLDADALEVRLLMPDGSQVFARGEYRPPTRFSLFPPLIAIALAILFRAPVLALAVGVLSGAFLVRWHPGVPVPEAAAQGLLDFGRTYFWNQLTDTFRIEIVLFVLFMLAMVGIITRAGGIQGLMNRIAGLASDLRRTQIATWLMGLAIFFDDYANTILVGSTMRPLADRFRMAREKLAYIVDATAAPVAGISIFSTWIAFEVSTFSAQLPDAGLAPAEGYAVFVQTLPYRFYCILTIFMVGLLVFTGRAFGPMLKAERRASSGLVLREGAKPLVGTRATELAPAQHVVPRARVALLPLAVFVCGAIGYMMIVGGAFSPGFDAAGIQSWNRVLSAGGGSSPLMYGALAGLIVASTLAWFQRLGREILSAAWTTVRAMGIAIVILYLAWMIGAVCSDLGTATYLSVLLREELPAIALPLILFLLASVVAFSTGSSWSTMTILLPIVVGLAYNLGETGPMGGLALLVISIGAVLEGAIFGDHCSPISDTTVMSSIASASDHIDHVRTQAPYAVLVMVVSLVFGYFPAALFAEHGHGWLPFACLGVGATVITAFVFFLGEKVASAAPQRASGMD